MNREQRLEWMAIWCAKNGCQLVLEGTVGFGRECVGILKDGHYPDYDYKDKPWVPQDAYHKHDCVAVLGQGEEAETQLYEWIKWFDDNGYTVSSEENKARPEPGLEFLHFALGRHIITKMVKRGALT